MEQYISKSALVTELNRLIAELVEEGEDTMFEQGRISAFEDVKVFINHTLEVKEVNEEPVSKDLEEAIKKYLKSLRKSHFEGYDIERAFKKGAQWQKERILNNATEREVKVDVCGYPYIDFTELYDYDKDIPLAKEGDKVKLVIIGEDKL